MLRFLLLLCLSSFVIAESTPVSPPFDQVILLDRPEMTLERFGKSLRDHHAIRLAYPDMLERRRVILVESGLSIAEALAVLERGYGWRITCDASRRAIRLHGRVDPKALSDGRAGLTSAVALERAQSAWELARWGDPAVVPLLQPLLDDEDEVVVRHVFRALYQLRRVITPEGESSAALLDALQRLRQRAHGLIEPERLEDLVFRLDLGDIDAAAAHSDGLPERHLVHLVEHLIDIGDPRGPALVAKHLMTTGAREELDDALDRAPSDQAVTAWLQIIDANSNHYQARAAHGLGMHLDDSRTLPALLELSRDSDLIVRGRALQGLAAYDDPRALEILERAARSRKPNVASHALYAFLHNNDPRFADIDPSLIERASSWERMRVDFAFLAVDRPEAAPYYRQRIDALLATGDERSLSRVRNLLYLLQSNTHAWPREVVDGLTTHPDPGIRTNAQEIAAPESPDTLEDLLQVVRDESDPAQLRPAMKALSLRRHPVARDAALAIVGTSKDPDLLRFAIGCLDRYDDDQVRQALVRLADQSIDRNVRRDAQLNLYEHFRLSDLPELSRRLSEGDTMTSELAARFVTGTGIPCLQQEVIDLVAAGSFFRRELVMEGLLEVADPRAAVLLPTMVGLSRLYDELKTSPLRYRLLPEQIRQLAGQLPHESHSRTRRTLRGLLIDLRGHSEDAALVETLNAAIAAEDRRLAEERAAKRARKKNKNDKKKKK